MKFLFTALLTLGLCLTSFGALDFTSGRFKASHEGVTYIESGAHGAWLLKFDDGKWLSARQVEREKDAFSEFKTAEGKVARWDSRLATVEVTVRHLPNGSLESVAKVTTKTGVVTELSFPAQLTFSAKDVERFIHPGRGNETMGLAFNSNFFAEKRSLRVPYPPLFADWARLETKSGAAFQIFGVQRRGDFQVWKNPKPFVPGWTTTGADGKGTGFYDHAYAMFLPAGQTITTPKVRLSEGGSLDDSLSVYMNENGLGRSLKDKCSVHPDPKFLTKLAASPMFLMFGSCEEISKATERLPTPTMLHLHNYMLHGFDRGNPDFLPPNPKFGTADEMKALIKKVKAQGNLFCPYANPCWWGDEPRSETFQKVGMEPVVRMRDGQPQKLNYGGNLGFNVTYFHPAVQAANRKVRDSFWKDYGIDIMFQDQCGSLPWFWDFNRYSPSPTAHTEGMISIVEEDSRVMPISTEDGWDMVADNEIGLTGCAWRTIPLEDMVGRRLYKQGTFPANTYTLEPVAARMFRDKLMFYHHDLAGFTTNERVLAWVLALGYNVVVGYHAKSMEDDPWVDAWYKWLHAIQSKILAKTVGGKVEYFKHDRSELFKRDIDPAVPYDDGVVQAIYGGIKFDVNLSDVPRLVGGKRLAPYGWWIEGKGVRAGKLEGSAPFIEADGERIVFCPPPTKPAMRTRSPGGIMREGAGEMHFKWQMVDRESRAIAYFKVQVSERFGGKIIAEKKTDAIETVERSTTIKGLLPEIEYTYTVTAFDLLHHQIAQCSANFRIESEQPKRVENQNVWWAGKDYWDRRHQAKLKEIATGEGIYDCVFLGDSITHNWEGWSEEADIEVVNRVYNNGKGELKFPNGPGIREWQRLKDKYKVLNLAIGGDATEHLLWRMRNGALDGYRAKIFALMIGTNNQTDDPKAIATGVGSCIAEIRKRHPEAKILLHAILPRDPNPNDRLRIRNAAVNRLIHHFADNESIFWIDLSPKLLNQEDRMNPAIMPDYLHPLEAGYSLWREAIEPYLERFAGARFDQARPVWPETLNKTMNAMVDFRTVLKLITNQNIRVKIAAANAYRLSVNGEVVMSGPARAPLHYARLDDFNIPMKAGINEILIEVNGYNCNNFVYPNQQPFLQAEVLDQDQVLASTATNGSFRAYLSPRVIKTPRLSFQRAFSEAWKVGNAKTKAKLQLVEIDPPKLLPRMVPYPKHDMDRSFREIAEINLTDDPNRKYRKSRCRFEVPSTNFRGYHPSECETDVWIDLYRYRRAKKDEKVITTGKIYEGNCNQTGFLQVDVTCTKPGRFVAILDELLTDGDVNPLRIELAAGGVWDIEQPGHYQLELFEPHTFKYVKLAFVSGAGSWNSPKVRKLLNPELDPIPSAPNPIANDKDLLSIYRAAVQTLAGNVLDSYMDCPSRERAAWLTDAYFSAPAVQLLCGNTKIERAFLENFALPKSFPDLPHGMVPMCYPADHSDGMFIPTFAMWYVLQLADYVKRSGDREMASLSRHRVEHFFDFLAQYRNSDGLLEKLPSWVFLGWDKANDYAQDVNYPANMLYAACLREAGKLYQRSDWEQTARTIIQTVRQQSLSGLWFRDHAIRDGAGKLIVQPECTETCQYYAFYFGVADFICDHTSWEKLLRKEINGLSPSGLFPGELLRLKCMRSQGYIDLVHSEIKSYFLKMAKITGTLWEHDSPWASCSHAFAASIVEHLLCK